ncbi:MAG: type VI secretion system protein TssA [Thermoanaerobaculaceae bacterium]|jgi:type VI secretion system protein VasJ|nr:type VI secretion system protein TssA [Thermoanaerobaculaceae bacterium]
MPYVLGTDFEACLKPFAGALPYGEDPKADSTFFDLRAEIQKLTAHSSTQGGVDWKAVKAWSLEILGKRSKDLTTASYLSLALFLTDGYRGLADGLAVLTGLAGEHWDGVFPPVARPRTRVTALEWLVARLAPLVEDRPPAADEQPVVAEIRDLVNRLQEVAQSKLLHEAPPFGELLSAVSARVASAQPAPAPATEPQPPTLQPSAAPAPAAPPPATSTPTPSSQPIAVPAAAIPATGASLSDLKTAFAPLLAAWRQVEPVNPAHLRIARSLRWDELAGPPPADPASGRTRLSPPRPQLRTALDGAFTSSRWQDLLQASEGAFGEPAGTFWLDLQMYSAIAVENLEGARGKVAAETVKSACRELLQRMPTLPELSFSDGAPFAAERTRKWLDEICEEAAPTLSIGGPAAAGAQGSALEAGEIAQARELFGKKKLGQALEILQRGIERAGTARSRFHTRLDAAQACLQAEQEGWARTLLEELGREMEGFTFERWQPETAIQVYQLTALCYARLAKDRKTENRETLRAEVEKLKARLFRLDMRAAAVVEEMLR